MSYERKHRSDASFESLEKKRRATVTIAKIKRDSAATMTVRSYQMIVKRDVPVRWRAAVECARLSTTCGMRPARSPWYAHPAPVGSPASSAVVLRGQDGLCSWR